MGRRYKGQKHVVLWANRGFFPPVQRHHGTTEGSMGTCSVSNFTTGCHGAGGLRGDNELQ